MIRYDMIDMIRYDMERRKLGGRIEARPADCGQVGAHGQAPGRTTRAVEAAQKVGGGIGRVERGKRAGGLLMASAGPSRVVAAGLAVDPLRSARVHALGFECLHVDNSPPRPGSRPALLLGVKPTAVRVPLPLALCADGGGPPPCKPAFQKPLSLRRGHFKAKAVACRLGDHSGPLRGPR